MVQNQLASRPVISPRFLDRKTWPKADSERVCVLEAIEIVGAVLHRDDWSGEELKANSAERPAGTTLRLEFDEDSHERLVSVVEWIAQRARDGVVRTFARRQAGGELFPLGAYIWNVEDPLAVFVANGGYYSLEHGPEYGHQERRLNYVFCSCEDLQRALSASESTSTSLEPASARPTSSTQSRKGRRPGSGGFAKKDAELVKKMRELIEKDPDMTPHAAAAFLAGDAAGGGSFETKQRRLATRYRDVWSN